MSYSIDPRESLIIVETELRRPAGKDVVRLALDTGANITVIDPRMLIGIGYDPVQSANRVPITTGSGIEHAPVVSVAQVTARGRGRSNFAVLGHTLPASAGIDGVLGLDFLRDLIVTIDFRAGQIDIA